MDRAKYIMVEINGLDCPIVFPEWVTHDAMARRFAGEVKSAGFVDLTGTVCCFGESSSLKKKSDPMDEAYIKVNLQVRESAGDYKLRQRLEAIEFQVARLQKENAQLRRGLVPLD